VADSQIPLLDANLESFDGLRRNLLDHSVDLKFIPLVFQYNKRDLDNLIPVETFNSLLNPSGFPYVESCAIKGKGVFETLKEITKLAIPVVKEKIKKDERKIVGKDRLKEKKEEQKGLPKQKDEFKFVTKKVGVPLRVTKVKFKTQKDFEKELENLAKDFTGRKE
jgi:hypothetical protein